jgi:preprotein translocase subunit SecY
MYSKHQNDLTKKILFTLFILVICRVGSFIPIPGIDSVALSNFANQNQGGILGMFNMLSGGSLERMSIFALAIMPYITASIIIQLMTIAYKPLENLKKKVKWVREKLINYPDILQFYLRCFKLMG